MSPERFDIIRAGWGTLTGTPCIMRVVVGNCQKADLLVVGQLPTTELPAPGAHSRRCWPPHNLRGRRPVGCLHQNAPVPSPRGHRPATMSVRFITFSEPHSRLTCRPHSTVW
jgi:hypothetical protein